MYVVLDLFGYHGHVRRLVELVAATAVLVGVVIFEGEFRGVACAQECPCSKGMGL